MGEPVPISSSPPGPSERLVGLVLGDKWNVVERIRLDDGITGASRSACYRATSRSGDVAFVKAFDFRRTEREGNTELLESMVREFNYEKTVHYYCVEQGVSRVTRIYDAGNVTVDGETVHFIICEWANKCLRESQPPGDSETPLSDRLFAVRDIASALAQLHQAGVAHQDAKPSNAMCPSVGAVKLADLGSSSCERIDAPPHDAHSLVGQPNYAPYELLYEQPPTSWRRRRFGCDLFLLGNLCFTSLIGGSLSFLALHAIPAGMRPAEFTGNYSEVLPYLLEAHELIIPAAINERVAGSIAKDLISTVAALCHPDPTKRGHPKNVLFGSHQFGLERFISRFDVLANRMRAADSGKR